MKEFQIRMGDGSLVRMTEEEIRSDIRADLGLGLCHVEPSGREKNGMAAKFRIEEVLGIRSAKEKGASSASSGRALLL